MYYKFLYTTSTIIMSILNVEINYVLLLARTKVNIKKLKFYNIKLANAFLLELFIANRNQMVLN